MTNRHTKVLDSDPPMADTEPMNAQSITYGFRWTVWPASGYTEIDAPSLQDAESILVKRFAAAGNGGRFRFRFQLVSRVESRGGDQ